MMKLIHSHRGVLAVVPLLVTFAALWVSATQGPSYVAENSDPDYVYGMNALNVIALHAPAHVDHPGTPVQIFVAAVFVLVHAATSLNGEYHSVIEDVIRDPERYLSFAKLGLLALIVGVMFYAGHRVYALSGSLPAAVALQGIVLLFPIALTSIARVDPEPMLIAWSLLYVLPFFELACAQAANGEIDPRDARRCAILAGIIFALAVSTKFTFLPLVLMVFVLPGWRDWLRFLAAAAVAGVVAIVPILSRLSYVGDWLSRIVTHQGIYGSGETGFPSLSLLATSAKEQFKAEMFLPVWIVSLLVFSVLIPKIRRPLLIAGLCCLAQLAIVIKHPGPRYLIPCFAAIAFGMALVLVQGGRRARASVAILTLASLYPSWQTVSTWAERRRVLNLSIAQIRRAVAEEGNCRVIGYYGSSNVVSELFFGDEGSGGLHAGLLRSLYPDATRYHTFMGTFQGWGGEDRTIWVLDQLRAGKCFLLQGSFLYEEKWPAATGIERIPLTPHSVDSENLYLLSLPGIPIQGLTPHAAGSSATAAPSSPDAIVIEAETFSGGNAIVDKDSYGLGIGVITTPKTPASAEYKINIPKTGDYEIYARYASDGARPVALTLNGKTVSKDFCGITTGGFYPSKQHWFSGGVFRIASGTLTMAVSSEGPFPHIDKFALVPFTTAK